MNERKPDFSGCVSKYGVVCGDGRTIKHKAFDHMDNKKVPLVWQHFHETPENILGHVLLHAKEDGLYGDGFFNDSSAGQNAKTLVQHGDITQMSIFANKLKQLASEVAHGMVREVSLVIAGANPDARIENVSFQHADGLPYESEDECIIHSGDSFSLDEKKEPEHDENENLQQADTNEDMTVQEIIDSMTEEQRQVMYAMIGTALEDAAAQSDLNDKEGDEEMKHNLFDGATLSGVEENKNTLSHDDMQNLFREGKRLGSFREAFRAAEIEIKHSVDDISYLFPDYKPVAAGAPDFLSRDMGWVTTVMNGVHKTPFARIRSWFADITEDQARALGYIKGKQKKEEVFPVLRRTTDPKTIYKLQKFDRDDLIDITDFDFIAWIKGEMRLMLNEEVARAILVGDGRPADSDDKITETNIRPIWKDDDLYTIKVWINTTVNNTDDLFAKAFLRSVIKSRVEYKGSGTPTMFITENRLADLMLLEDATGRIIYDSMEKLRAFLRVSNIITVPVMENQTRDVSGQTRTLEAIIVNLNDYNVGMNRGGAVTLFDDFDIDYNKYTYLIETRLSGALIRPLSAIAIESGPAGA